MKLNCKPGDLAVIVRTKRHPHYIGKIVKCVAFVPWPDGEAAWEFEPKLDTFWCILDSCLKPLRDNPGQDEILRIVGLPEKEPA